uniref:ATP synthase subunit a n=1 Tax=Ascoschoengastia sp. TATW-1 TaxID=436354 RepID=B3IUN1_9ACAR|nr:ATPase subunit 6 [Ascoschoengastia sp. TATW-1]
MNLFSSFDPSSFLLPLVFVLWMSFIMLQISFNKISLSKLVFYKFMSGEVSPNMSSFNQNSSVKKFVSVFSLLLIINLAGLLPSSFSWTTQVSMNFPLAILFWLTVNVFSLIKKSKSFFSHMIPLGTPMSLVFFMVLVELVSNLIRPITLSVRLTANMVAGHILISLMESFVMKMNPNIIISFLSSSILIILETGVSFIQAYVFSILVSLYFSENH